MKQILISGYYGFHNAGDEAILNALYQLFAPYQTQVKVLCKDDQHSLPGCNFEAISRTDPIAIQRAMKESDLFISGGGGLFQDVTGSASVPYYGGLLEMAHWNKTPSMIFGQGIGPLKKPWSKAMVRHFFKRPAWISVRDQDSVDFLHQMGIPKTKTHLTADPVLTLLPPATETVQKILQSEGILLNRPVIGVSIRPWHSWYEKQLKSFSAVLAQFAAQTGAQILLIPFQAEHDTWICNEAAYSLRCRPASYTPSIHVLQGHYSPTEMLGIIGQMDMVVGMRLHSLIMAAACEVPAVGLVYDPKVRNFSQRVSYKYISSIEALVHCDTFYEYLNHAWTERHAIRQVLSQKLPSLRQSVYDTLNTALKLMRYTP